ncbi:hypothetical protein [Streptomyces sp. ZSW22]|uniref:hypothetical protein n=1 Tax=Streptomyces sp. ZSW22 TaxID=3055050 RepID=UPI0025B0F70F|nr:hypothetical protein [Streptomyces sp. ZSW22]MDN3244115.1 hypothetical protein [Streptomyces sp. ZSW22]
MTPYERLMAEALPTGTFGHAQPTTIQPRTRRPWTEEEQAQHRADLEAALTASESRGPRRHLTAVPDQPAA